jgi:hypothetical protein
VTRRVSHAACSSSGPQTSQRRSVPTARSPSTGGIARTCSASSVRYSRAGQNPMYRSAAVPASHSRKLASTHESTQDSIVPPRSSLKGNRRRWRSSARLFLCNSCWLARPRGECYPLGPLQSIRTSGRQSLSNLRYEPSVLPVPCGRSGSSSTSGGFEVRLPTIEPTEPIAPAEAVLAPLARAVRPLVNAVLLPDNRPRTIEGPPVCQPLSTVSQRHI